MTNEEKAKEFDARAWEYFNNERKADNAPAYRAAILMAEWKDQQFKEYLEKKRARAKEAYITIPDKYEDYLCGKIDAISEIINELFKEE